MKKKLITARIDQNLLTDVMKHNRDTLSALLRRLLRDFVDNQALNT